MVLSLVVDCLLGFWCFGYCGFICLIVLVICLFALVRAWFGVFYLVWLLDLVLLFNFLFVVGFCWFRFKVWLIMVVCAWGGFCWDSVWVVCCGLALGSLLCYWCWLFSFGVVLWLHFIFGLLPGF